MGVEDTNFNAQLTKIRAARPDMIYNGGASRVAILSGSRSSSSHQQPLIVTQAAVSKAFFDAIGGAKEADGLMTPIQLGSFGEEAGGDTAKLYKELKAAMPTQVVYFATFATTSA